MANKTLTPNEMNFVQTLLMNGYSLATALSLVGKSFENANKVSEQYPSKKDNNSKADKSASNKSTSKGRKGKTTAPKGAPKDTELKLGKVKKGNYFQCVNATDKKVNAVGKAKTVDLKGGVVTTKGGKKFALANCSPISKATYGKLSKQLKKAKVGKNKPLSPADFKQVYAAVLRSKDKITDQDLAKAQSLPDYATELYKQFKDEIKLTDADAKKFLAEKSDKNSTQA